MKRARLRSALLVILPVGLWLGVALPFWAAALLIVIVAGVLVLLSQLIGPGLNTKEAVFWDKYGALPEVLMMRQRGPGHPKIRSLSSETITKIEILFGVSPTLEEETANPQHADSYYAKAAHAVRCHIKTCGDGFLLQQARLDYENKLHFWLLRKPGRWLAGLSVLMCTIVLAASLDDRHNNWFDRLGDPTLETVAAFAALCCCSWLFCFWVFKVTRHAVFTSGVKDAETLFSLFAANPMPVLVDTLQVVEHDAAHNADSREEPDRQETEKVGAFAKLKARIKAGWQSEETDTLRT